MDRYVKGEVLGIGLHGKVIKAIDQKTGRVVAIKKMSRVCSDTEGMDQVVLREIMMLKELRHENVVQLLEVFEHKKKIRLVCEYLATDLEAMVRNENVHISDAAVKSCMLMILRAVAHCHKNNVVHRDLKPNNLLISVDGSLKLADFGTARFYGSPHMKFTPQVFHRSYRAPELLLGSKNYGAAVDMWAIGCIFAELMIRRPYFACDGERDMEQLATIFTAIGSPTDDQLLEMSPLPFRLNNRMSGLQGKDKTAIFENACPEAIDLLEGLLRYSPRERMTAEEALQHPYLSTSQHHREGGASPSTTLLPCLAQLLDHNKVFQHPAQSQGHGRRHMLRSGTRRVLGTRSLFHHSATPNSSHSNTSGHFMPSSKQPQVLATRTSLTFTAHRSRGSGNLRRQSTDRTPGSSLISFPMLTPATDASHSPDENSNEMKSATKKRRTEQVQQAENNFLLNAFEEVADM